MVETPGLVLRAEPATAWSAEGPLAGRVRGVVCCAFPLHLPGRPERSRAHELLAPDVPRLVCQGERDTFGTADEVAATIGPESTAVRLVRIPGADHGMKLPRRADRDGEPFGLPELRALLTDEVARFVLAD